MNLQENQFKSFVSDIKKRVLQGQYEALKSVNKELISLYLDIGKSIVKKQEEHGWGKSIVQNLSAELQKEFVGMKGFSTQNLWNMRQFYLEYKENLKLQPLVREISWTKNILIHQVEANTYENFLINQTNFDKTMLDKFKYQAVLAVKDELPQQISQRLQILLDDGKDEEINRWA